MSELVKAASKPRYQSFFTQALRNLRLQLSFQFLCPTKSLTGYIVTKMEARATKPVYSALIRHLDIQPDHSIYEIGFGRGTGLELVLDKIYEGNGHVFGTELSQYAMDVTIDNLDEFINDRVTIYRTGLYNHLPFPSNWFDGILHVDIFYAWNRQNMHEICAELFRVLKPGCCISCGMEMSRLDRLAKWRLLRRVDYDPMRYIEGLEASGFEEIEVNYEQIDAHGEVSEERKKGTREIQIINARKPPGPDNIGGLDALLEKLEAEIREMEEQEAAAKKALESGEETTEQPTRSFNPSHTSSLHPKSMAANPKKVTIVGSGNWGSAIARIIGNTVKQHSSTFQQRVPMWVFEEMVDGKKLSEIINTQHENVKYLPGKKIPDNIVAVPDLLEASQDSDILVFVVPHQFVSKLCAQLKDKVKKSTIAVSLIKGLSPNSTSAGLRLISEDISEMLGIDCAVLMGANLAPEVANDNFCEATVGSKNVANGMELKKLFHTDNFRINVVQDVATVELCGALKNVVACAAGFSDGLGYGDNTKAAIIRLGLMEMMRFIEHFYPGTNMQTFFESCGIADLVTTCYGGRNKRVCEAFVKTKKPLAEVEQELLKGQSAQGPLTAAELFEVVEKHNLLERFPLFVAVHKICTGQFGADQLIGHIRNHPEHNESANHA